MSTTTQKQTTPTLVVEKIFGKFREQAATVFAEFGEPAAFMIVTSWAVGQNDFPAGDIITRNKEITLDDYLALIGQMHKLQTYLNNRYQTAVANINKQLAAKISAQPKETKPDVVVQSN